MGPYLILLSAVILILLKLKRKTRKAELINKLPGPSGIPILGHALQFIGVERTDRISIVMKNDRTYGPIYRIWKMSLPFVHITSAELAEVVLNLKNTKKGQVYRLMEPWFGRGLLTSDGEEWRKSRKLITPTFHFQILETFLKTFNVTSQQLVKKLQQLADTDNPVDIYPLITLAGLDSICETAMGVNINAQGESKTAYVQAVYDAGRLLFYRYDRVWLYNDWIWHRSSAGKENKKVLNILHEFVDNVIRERRLTRKIERSLPKEEVVVKKDKAFLDLLLDECEKQNVNFTDTQVRDEVNTFMFEGHDTTTAGLCFTIHMLAVHPDIQEEVYEEVLSVTGPYSNDMFSITELSNLKLLERVIKESLRLYPPVPFISRTLNEDSMIGEYLIPSGSVVLMSLASILRDPRHFPDPEKFNPDRFLKENIFGRNSYAHIPFSAGIRNCIGQRFAMLESKVILAQIIKNFRIEAVTKVEDLKLIVEMVQRPAVPIKLKLFSRAH